MAANNTPNQTRLFMAEGYADRRAEQRAEFIWNSGNQQRDKFLQGLPELQTNCRQSNHRAVRDDAVLGNNHDAVADEIQWMVHVLRLARRRDDDVVPDARVLVDDRVVDPRVGADADARAARRF